MKNYDILEHYSKTDLRRLAKGKISEIVGMDASRILHDLSRVLGNYESIKHNVEFRTPPAHTILEVLLEADGYMVHFSELKPRVRARIKAYRALAKELDLADSAKGYRLYATVLEAAWKWEGDLNPAEQNILRVLRSELAITRTEHQLIMAHPKIGRMAYDEESYSHELEFLSQEGIVLVCTHNDEGHFVLSDETAESLKQLWGIELEREQYGRLLACLTNPQLREALRTFDLRLSGNRDTMVARIIEGDVRPSVLLDSLSGSELASMLGKLDLAKSGAKDDKVLRLVDHFKYDADLAVDVDEEDMELPPEDSLLPDTGLVDLLQCLDVGQLGAVLADLDLKKSGSKAQKVDRLAQSRFNAATILDSLPLPDLRELAGSLGEHRSGRKGALVETVIAHFRNRQVEDSLLSTSELFAEYDALSRQDHRIYPPDSRPSVTRMGLDFERATRYLFKNVFKLDTKTQRAGHEEPDGIVTDDEGRFFYYECKTVLAPPYRLPIAHRLQVRNYVTLVLASRRAQDFAGYVIISHSFSKDIEEKLAAVLPDAEVPVAVIAASDLAAFAKKWEQDHPIETFDFIRAISDGRITLRDLQNAAWR